MTTKQKVKVTLLFAFIIWYALPVAIYKTYKQYKIMKAMRDLAILINNSGAITFNGKPVPKIKK